MTNLLRPDLRALAGLLLLLAVPAASAGTVTSGSCSAGPTTIAIDIEAQCSGSYACTGPGDCLVTLSVTITGDGVVSGSVLTYGGYASCGPTLSSCSSSASIIVPAGTASTFTCRPGTTVPSVLIGTTVACNVRMTCSAS